MHIHMHVHDHDHDHMHMHDHELLVIINIENSGELITHVQSHCYVIISGQKVHTRTREQKIMPNKTLIHTCTWQHKNQ
jgi:hypothetical protein